MAGLLYEMKPPLIYVNFLMKKMSFLQKPVKYQDYLILLVLNELSSSTNLLKEHSGFLLKKKNLFNLLDQVHNDENIKGRESSLLFLKLISRFLYQNYVDGLFQEINSTLQHDVKNKPQTVLFLLYYLVIICKFFF